jgi:hypothetical protein
MPALGVPEQAIPGKIPVSRRWQISSSLIRPDKSEMGDGVASECCASCEIEQTR